VIILYSTLNILRRILAIAHLCDAFRKSRNERDLAKSEYHKGVCLPWYDGFLNGRVKGVKELMGEKVVNDISSKVLSLSQKFIQSSYSYKERTPMGDSSRNKLFGNKFAQSVSPSLAILSILFASVC
jgi:hypothetical protein